MYDYYLGGCHNFASDRATAKQIICIYPDAPLAARANRAFLRRAIAFASTEGMDQFLDLGSGIPTTGNVHEIAQAINSASRVVYVDSDPVAINHAQAILYDNPNATALQADIRQPHTILGHPDVQRLLDFRRPVAIVLSLLLHFIPIDDDAYRLAKTLRDAVPSGSHLILAHATLEDAPPTVVEQVERLYTGARNPTKARSRSHIEAFFEGWGVVEPGVVVAASGMH